MFNLLVGCETFLALENDEDKATQTNKYSKYYKSFKQFSWHQERVLVMNSSDRLCVYCSETLSVLDHSLVVYKGTPYGLNFELPLLGSSSIGKNPSC